MSRDIIDAKSDDNGKITQVKIDGNTNFTSVEKAIDMAEKGKLNVVVVDKKDGSKHIRSNGNSSKSDNLGSMAEKNKSKKK